MPRCSATPRPSSPGPSLEKPEGAHRESRKSANLSTLAENKRPQKLVDFWSLILSEWWRRVQMNPGPRLEKKRCEPKSNSRALFLMSLQMPNFIVFVLVFRTWYARKFPSMVSVLHLVENALGAHFSLFFIRNLTIWPKVGTFGVFREKFQSSVRCIVFVNCLQELEHVQTAVSQNERFTK